MKSLLSTLILCLLSVSLFSQTIYVPFRVGDKLGLSDTNFNIIEPAVHNEIYGVSHGQGIFRFEDKLVSKTIINTYGNKLKYTKIKTGIIYKGKKLFESEKFNDYEMAANSFFIAYARSGFYERNTKTICTDSSIFTRYKDRAEEAFWDKRKRFLGMFNLKGEEVYPDGFKRVYPIHAYPQNSSNPRKSKPKYVLLLTQNFDNRVDLAQYNTEKGAIDKWFLKDKAHIKRSSKGYFYKIGTLDVRNSKQGAVELYNYKETPNGYIVTKKEEKKIEEENGTNKISGAASRMVVPADDGYDLMAPAISMPDCKYVVEISSDKKSANRKRPISIRNMLIEKNKVSYKKGYDRNTPDTHFLLPQNMDTAYLTNIGQQIVDKDSMNIHHRIGVVQIKNKWQFFTNHLAPEKYDSIWVLLGPNSNRQWIGLKKNPKTKSKKYYLMNKIGELLIREPLDNIKIQVNPYKKERLNTLYHNSDFIQLYKNKLVRLYDLKNSKYLPESYEQVHYDGGVIHTNYQTKKNNLHGFISKNYREGIKIIPPIFKYKVGGIISDYNNYKGFDLVRLEDAAGKFFAYATKSGKVFYRPPNK